MPSFNTLPVTEPSVWKTTPAPPWPQLSVPGCQAPLITFTVPAPFESPSVSVENEFVFEEIDAVPPLSISAKFRPPGSCPPQLEATDQSPNGTCQVSNAPA